MNEFQTTWGGDGRDCHRLNGVSLEGMLSPKPGMSECGLVGKLGCCTSRLVKMRSYWIGVGRACVWWGGGV